MIDKHEEAAREAAAQGAQVMCFQELFYGPYFCQVQEAQYYEYTEAIPDGPTTQRFQSVAASSGWSSCSPCTRWSRRASTTTPRPSSTPTARTSAYRKHHILQVKGFWEKFTPAREPGIPGASTRRQGRRLHLPRPPLPGGLAGARPERRQHRLQPLGHQPRTVGLPLEAGASWPSAVANEYYIGAINRVGIEPLGDNDFYGTSYFVDPEGKFVGDTADDHKLRAGRARARHGPHQDRP